MGHVELKKPFPIKGGRRWGAPWVDRDGTRHMATDATIEGALAKRAKKTAGWRGEQTLADYLDWWLNVYLVRRISDGRIELESVAGYEQSVRLNIFPYLGHVMLNDLDPIMIEDWLDALHDRGLGARGRQKALRTLSAAMSVAEYRRMVPSNPVKGVEGPRVKGRKVEAWTLPEVEAFMKACVEHPELYGDLWLVQFGLGLRPSEALALQLRDVEPDRARIHRNLVWRKGGQWVLKDEDKGKDDIWVGLPDFAQRAVARQLERRVEMAKWSGWTEHGFLFAARTGKPMRATSIGRPLERICGLAGIERLTPHMLRHQTAATLLSHFHVPLDTIRFIMRHKQQRTTSDLYSHLAEDARGRATSHLNQLGQ